MKRMSTLLLAGTLILFAASCEAGLNIVEVKLGEFPNNIVYFVDESDSIDLTGGTIITRTGDGRAIESPIYNDSWLEITDNVDFSAPGVYEVVIRRQPGGDKDNDYLVARIPIQVLQR